MIINNYEDYTELLPEEGMMLTDGEIITNRVNVPIDVDYSQWYEIDEPTEEIEF